MRRDIQRLYVMLGIQETYNNFIVIKEHYQSGKHDSDGLLNQLGLEGEKNKHAVEVWYQTL